jgi:predicted nucleic acid-binding protein
MGRLMAAVEKVYIDTNVFILAFENRGIATTLLKQLFTVERGKACFATSELTLSELLVKPFREANNRMIDAYEAVIVRSAWLDVLPVGKPVLRHAARLRTQYSSLKLPDAIHISTAFASECSHMLTADQGLKSSYEIGTYSSELQREPLTILHPDEPTLRSLIKSLAE